MKEYVKMYLNKILYGFLVLAGLAVLGAGCTYGGTAGETEAAGACTEAEAGALTEAEAGTLTEAETAALTEADTAVSLTEAERAAALSEAEREKEKETPFTEVNGSIPFFGEEEKKRTDAFESYSELDSLGRCGAAYANLCAELMPTEERGEIGQIRPSGWHTVKYNDLIDGNYLYNRCHLIAYSLAGENANEKNLITGTRYLNKEGMLPFELQVGDYIRATGNHVLYRVTPVYKGEDLVASGVLMEAWSVEDEGRGVCFCVYCFNVQPGIVIDYLTGESRRESEEPEKGMDPSAVGAKPGEERSAGGGTRTGNDSEGDGGGTRTGNDSEKDSGGSGTEGGSDQKDTQNTESVSREFILNTNSHKIHLPTCDSVNDIKEKNKKSYVGTIEELKEMGYTPCKRCLAGKRTSGL